MPEHVRPGLVENAGGQLMCPWPKCRLPLTMQGTVVATKPYTVHVDHRRVATVSAAGGELTNTFAVIIHLTCEAGHLSQVALETDAEGTRTETWWDDDPKPEEGEL